MKRILLLSPQNVIPATDGGKKGIYMPMKMLAEEFAVKAIIFCDEEEKFNKDDYSRIAVNALPARINKKDSAVSAVSNLFSKQPFKFSKYYSAAHAKLIEHICVDWQPDVIICHHAHLAEYCEGLKQKFPAINLILREHNVEYLLVEQYYKHQKKFLLRQFAHWQFKKTKTYEIQCWNYFNTIAFISDSDFSHFTNPQGVKGYIIYDGTNRVANASEPHQKQNAFLFSGSMRSYQNVVNLKHFINNIWVLWKKDSSHSAGFELWITGDENKQFVSDSLGLNDDEQRLFNIKILGFVDDLTALMQKAKFFLSPTIMGAGIRIKLLEALGMGCVVFSTEKDLAVSQDLEDGKNLLLYNDAISFSQQFEKVIAAPEFYKQLSHNAITIAKQNFTWHVFYNNFKKIL